MRILCELGTGDWRCVVVSPNDYLYVLLDKLNITDKKTKFMYDSKIYDMASFETFQEIKLTLDNTRIFIYKPNAILGAGGSEVMNRFANLSDEFLRKDDVAHNNPNIPKWRTIGKGINLYGICNYNSCKAKGKQVIMHVKSDEYDVYNEGFLGICPMCKKHFDLDTCSFYKCDYKCVGTYFDKSEDTWVDLPGNVQKTSGGKDFYYDFNKPVRGKEGKVKYKKLILKVVSYHDYE